jgi:hypothetical protein
MSDHIRPLECGPLANQPHRAIRFVNPDDGGQLGTTYHEPLSLIIRPSTGSREQASVFVGHNLIHVPRGDAPAIASVLLNAAGCTHAEVLDALGGVDKVDVVAAERATDELRAKLAEAEATIGRVKAVHHDFYKVRGDWADEDGARALKRALDAALTPPKPFELPTEVPARIVAVKSSTGDEKELTLFTDGDTTWWADIEDWGPFWTRSQVMDQFTDHRLLDGEA